MSTEPWRVNGAGPSSMMSGSRCREVVGAVAGDDRAGPGVAVVLGTLSEVAAAARFGARVVGDVRAEDVDVGESRPGAVAMPGTLVCVAPSTTVVLEPPVMCSSAPWRSWRRSMVACLTAWPKEQADRRHDPISTPPRNLNRST